MLLVNEGKSIGEVAKARDRKTMKRGSATHLREGTYSMLLISSSFTSLLTLAVFTPLLDKS